jgi:hypothetical protein
MKQLKAKIEAQMLMTDRYMPHPNPEGSDLNTQAKKPHI